MDSSHRLSIFADFFQFIVMDVESTDDFSSICTDHSLKQMVATGNSALSFGTLRNVDVQVEIHVVGELPKLALDEYDHVAEGSFQTPTGGLAVMGCTDFLPDAYRLAVPPGSYQFLYLVSGVGSITDESSPASDLYTLYISPGANRPPRLIKHWQAAMQPTQRI